MFYVKKNPVMHTYVCETWYFCLFLSYFYHFSMFLNISLNTPYVEVFNKIYTNADSDDNTVAVFL